MASQLLKLVEGGHYTVIKEGAALVWPVPIAPSAWMHEVRHLKVGDELIYLGAHKGWGSDPIYEAKFQLSGTDIKGSFEPSSWGAVPQGWLEEL